MNEFKKELLRDRIEELTDEDMAILEEAGFLEEVEVDEIEGLTVGDVSDIVGDNYE